LNGKRSPFSQVEAWAARGGSMIVVISNNPPSAPASAARPNAGIKWLTKRAKCARPAGALADVALLDDLDDCLFISLPSE
jgi:hypothetical protein